MKTKPVILLALIIGIALISIIAVIAANTSERQNLPQAPDEPTTEVTATVTPTSEPTSRAAKTTQPAPIVPFREVELVAITLSGECYDDEIEDKRKVARLICNRASVGGDFGGTIEDVITKPKQFNGYWNPLRPVSESDIRIATEVLAEWYDNGQAMFEDGCLFFSGDGGKVNTFRKEY